MVSLPQLVGKAQQLGMKAGMGKGFFQSNL